MTSHQFRSRTNIFFPEPCRQYNKPIPLTPPLFSGATAAAMRFSAWRMNEEKIIDSACEINSSVPLPIASEEKLLRKAPHTYFIWVLKRHIFMMTRVLFTAQGVLVSIIWHH
jgi:hypothetical protein